MNSDNNFSLAQEAQGEKKTRILIQSYNKNDVFYVLNAL